MEKEDLKMRDILEKIGFEYIGNAANIIRDEKNDLSLLDRFYKKKGVYLFTEADQIIYVGRSDNLKDRIGQCLRKEKDSGSIYSVEHLSDNDFDRICKASIYVLLLEDDFKKNVPSYSIFQNVKG